MAKVTAYKLKKMEEALSEIKRLKAKVQGTRNLILELPSGTHKIGNYRLVIREYTYRYFDKGDAFNSYPQIEDAFTRKESRRRVSVK